MGINISWKYLKNTKLTGKVPMVTSHLILTKEPKGFYHSSLFQNYNLKWLVVTLKCNTVFRVKSLVFRRPGSYNYKSLEVGHPCVLTTEENIN